MFPKQVSQSPLFAKSKVQNWKSKTQPVKKSESPKSKNFRASQPVDYEFLQGRAFKQLVRHLCSQKRTVNGILNKSVKSRHVKAIRLHDWCIMVHPPKHILKGVCMANKPRKNTPIHNYWQKSGKINRKYNASTHICTETLKSKLKSVKQI